MDLKAVLWLWTFLTGAVFSASVLANPWLENKKMYKWHIGFFALFAVVCTFAVGLK